MLDQWEINIRERLQASGLTMKAASQAAGLNDSFVRDMLERGRVPSIDKFAKLAKVLGTTVADLMGEASVVLHQVPIMGFFTAGAEILPDFEKVPPGGLEQINVPFALPAEMIGFLVRDESMLPAYRDGAVVIVFREQRRPVEYFYGAEAAVKSTDGRRYLKTIIRGQGNTVNLLSCNANPIENVTLDWIGEIFAVLPKPSYRMYWK